MGTTHTPKHNQTIKRRLLHFRADHINIKALRASKYKPITTFTSDTMGCGPSRQRHYGGGYGYGARPMGPRVVGGGGGYCPPPRRPMGRPMMGGGIMGGGRRMGSGGFGRRRRC